MDISHKPGRRTRAPNSARTGQGHPSGSVSDMAPVRVFLFLTWSSCGRVQTNIRCHSAWVHVCWQHMEQCPDLCVTLCQPAFCLTCICTGVRWMSGVSTWLYSQGGVSDLSTADIWGWVVLCSGVTCAVSLASTHSLPVTPLRVCQSSMFPDISWWVKITLDILGGEIYPCPCVQGYAIACSCVWWGGGDEGHTTHTCL